MKSERSISRRFLTTVFLITTLSMAILAFVSIFVKYNECKNECELITETYINEQETIIKYEVERSVNIIKYRIKNSSLTIDNIKRISIEQLREIRFPNKGKDPGFFFVKSYDGIQMLSVSKPDLEGKDVSKYTDPNGIITHDLFMSAVSGSGSGFADYSWYNPFTKKVQKKRSYVKGIPELQWYIASGFWFEDINSVIDEKRAQLEMEVRNYILRLIIIILVAYITILIVSRNISGKIGDSFKKFSLFFKKAATEHAFIEKRDLHYLEFKELADSANQMISGRIKAEEDLSIMAQAFKSISDCVTITDLNNNLLYVNDSFLKTYEYEHDEIVGKKIDLFGSPRNPDGLHDQISQETFKEGWAGELWNTRKNGNEFQISLSSSVVKNTKGNVIALVGVSKDITERKSAEQLQKIIYNIAQASNNAEGLDKLIATIKEQLQLIIDVKNFYVAFYNEKDDTFSSPFALDENEEPTSWPAGKSCTAYVYRSQEPKLITKEEMIRLSKLGEVELVGKASEVWLGVPLKIKGKTYGVFVIQNYNNKDAYSEKDLEVLEFVSHQISISIERKRAESELLIAYEKSMESDRLKSAFLATMSHELRTPLNAVIGFSKLINEKLSKDKLLMFSETINKSGLHLLGIVEDIFDVTLLEVGQVLLNENEYPIFDIMLSINEMISVEKYGKVGDVELRFNAYSETKDLKLYTDKGKLTQIIINLLKNALKFTDKGIIEYGYHEINNEGHYIRFYVKDTGIGIAKENQKNIFDIFRQGDDSLTRNYDGTGIGLFVVKRYAEMLGGKVELESELGKGSTFYVTLPIAVKASKKNILNQEKTDQSLYQNKTILIVEDDYYSTQLLQELLLTHGIQYLTAKNGKEAVEFCKEKDDIDLVLMDIKMPEMDGNEATKIIKEDRPKLVVIAQTAHAILGDKENALNAGFDGYIAKPIENDKLSEILRIHLGEKS